MIPKRRETIQAIKKVDDLTLRFIAEGMTREEARERALPHRFSDLGCYT
jgi:hypothetical protein